MRWIDRTRVLCLNYRANKAELKRRRREPPSGRYKGIGKYIEDRVYALADDRREALLTAEIEAVDYALAEIASIASQSLSDEAFDIGNIVSRLADLVYIRQSHSLQGAARKLYISERTAYRYNKYFLRLVAARIGYLPKKK